MKNKSVLFTLFLLGITGMFAKAQTNVPALISTSQTWSPAGSPYIIQYTTTIDTHASVKVLPGTVIKSNGQRLLVNGEFQAIGTSVAPVMIDSVEINYNNGCKDYNDSTKGGAYLEYCFIKGLGSGRYTIKTTSTSIRVNACTFRNTYYCLYVYGLSAPSHTIIENCDMAGDAYGNGYPIYSSGSNISMLVNNNYIHDSYTLYVNGEFQFTRNKTNRLKSIQAQLNKNSTFSCNEFINMPNGVDLNISSYANPIDISILNNTFDTVGGKSGGTSLTYPMLKISRFSSAYLIRNFTATGNNFLYCPNSYDKVVINGTNSLPATPETLNFNGNYWASTDTTVIDSFIKDANDDPNLFAKVDYKNSYAMTPDTSCHLMPTSCPTNINFYYTANAKTVALGNTSTGGNNYKIYWDFGDGDTDSSSSQYITHKYNEAGTYVVCMSIFDAYDQFCGSKCDTIDLSSDTGCLADFYLAIDTTKKFNLYIVNSSKGITSNTQFYWSFGDGTGSSQRNPSHTYNSFGLYQLCLTIFDSSQNCYSTYCDSIGLDSLGKLLKKQGFTIQVLDETELNVEDKIKSSDKVLVYPNPMAQSIQIDFSQWNSNEVEWTLTDHTGKIILQSGLNLTSENSILQVDVSEIESGMYYLQVKSGDKQQIVRLIKL